MPEPSEAPGGQSSRKTIWQAIVDGEIDRVRDALDADPEFVQRRLSRNLTALQLAACCGRRGIVELLLQNGAKLDISTACVLGDAEALAKTLDADPSLIHKQSPDGWPLMHLASRFDRLEAAKVLLAHGADAGQRHKLHGRAPMHHAASPSMVQLLLDHGANINAKDHHRLTRLHSAAAHGDVEMVRFLLERGADPATKTKADQTPWFLAVRYRHQAAAEVLFSAASKTKLRR